MIDEAMPPSLFLAVGVFLLVCVALWKRHRRPWVSFLFSVAGLVLAIWSALPENNAFQLLALAFSMCPLVIDRHFFCDAAAAAFCTVFLRKYPNWNSLGAKDFSSETGGILLAVFFAVFRVEMLVMVGFIVYMYSEFFLH
jgi:hypothetical protein